jgi:hypothetical protein
LQEKAYSNTAERIFPVRAGDAQDMTAVLMAEARQKLATAQAKQHSQQLLQQQQQKTAQQAKGAGERQQEGSSSSCADRSALKVGAQAAVQTAAAAGLSSSGGTIRLSSTSCCLPHGMNKTAVTVALFTQHFEIFNIRIHWSATLGIITVLVGGRGK